MNNDQVAWTVCLDCGKRVTGDSIHTCSPQLKTLTDEEIVDSVRQYFNIHPEAKLSEQFRIKLYELEDFARAILKKASEK